MFSHFLPLPITSSLTLFHCASSCSLPSSPSISSSLISHHHKHPIFSRTSLYQDSSPYIYMLCVVLQRITPCWIPFNHWVPCLQMNHYCIVVLFQILLCYLIQGMSKTALGCPHVSIYHLIFHVVFVASPASSPSKGGGASPCIQLHPLY